MSPDCRENLLAEVRKQLAWARDQGIKLVVYPQYWGLNLVCPEETGERAKLLTYLQQEGAKAKQAFLDTCRDLAGEFGLYLLPGSFLEVAATPTGAPVRVSCQNRACLFSPRGQVILEQAQTHFSPWEEDLFFDWNTLPARFGFNPGDTLEVAKTPLGVLGLVLGTDARYPEVSRILTLQGAQVLLALTALPEPYNPWRQVAGMWQQVQQNQVYCAESCLVGNFLGQSFAGKSSLYGPCEITPGETGVFSQAESAAKPEKVVAQVALGTLAEIRSRYPLREHLNIPLYRQELGRVYDPEKGSKKN